MKLYRFSPITGKEQLLEAVSCIAKNTTQLCQKIIGEELPINPLTVFSHYHEEFENLKKILFELGSQVSEANGPYVKLGDPIQLPNNLLDQLRVRQPDPYRMQVGCSDFVVPNYVEFKNKYLNKCATNLRLISRPEYEMIEFFDPDFDVLAYILSN